jgi:hypothetical protein
MAARVGAWIEQLHQSLGKTPSRPRELADQCTLHTERDAFKRALLARLDDRLRFVVEQQLPIATGSPPAKVRSVELWPLVYENLLVVYYLPACGADYQYLGNHLPR